MDAVLAQSIDTHTFTSHSVTDMNCSMGRRGGKRENERGSDRQKERKSERKRKVETVREVDSQMERHCQRVSLSSSIGDRERLAGTASPSLCL